MKYVDLSIPINQILKDLKVKHSLEGRLYLERMLTIAFNSDHRLTMTQLYEHAAAEDTRNLTIDQIETNVRYVFRTLNPNTALFDKLFGELEPGEVIHNKEGFYALLYELRCRCKSE